MDKPNKVKIFFGVAASLAGTLLAAVYGLLDFSGRFPYKRFLICTFVRYLSYFGIRGEQAKTESTIQNYNQFIKTHSLQPRIIPLKNGPGTLCCLGSENSTKAVLFLHGGAYIRPMSVAHFWFLDRLMKDLRLRDVDFTLYILEYELAGLDHARKGYPAQLKQASAALSYLLNDLSISSSNIVILSDSAGSNLAIALLSHLIHPHPRVPKIDLKEKPKFPGLVALSPWVTFSQTSASMRSNARYDFVDKGTLKRAGEQFMSGNVVDEYNTPLSADPEWWKDSPVENILITSGGCEVFRDDIDALAKKMKIRCPQLEYYDLPHEIHDQPVFGCAVGWPKCQSQEICENWMAKVFGK